MYLKNYCEVPFREQIIGPERSVTIAGVTGQQILTVADLLFRRWEVRWAKDQIPISLISELEADFSRFSAPAGVLSIAVKKSIHYLMRDEKV